MKKFLLIIIPLSINWKYLEISFATKSLRLICENKNIAIESYSNDIANKLVTRLADLSAIKFVTEISLGNPSELMLGTIPSYKIDLANNVSLIFCANHVNNPNTKDGRLDWTKVSRIKITSIDITHE